MAATLLAGGGCHGVGPSLAVGRADHVSVFTNVPLDGPVASAIRNLLAYPVDVVGTDPAFQLEFVPFGRFGTHRRVKNQVFAADLSRSDALARFVSHKLSGRLEDRLVARKPFLEVMQDVWAEGQTSLVAVAWSPADLKALLAGDDSLDVRRAFEASVITGLTTTLFAVDEDRDLSARLARDHGFTLRVTPGFFAAEDPGERVVKLNASSPVRLILVHWEEGALALDAARWDSILTHVLRVTNEGDSVLSRSTRSYPTLFQDEPALKWEGLWQNPGYTIGGPFRAYAIHRGGRSFLLVGQVFAPGGDKVRILRQIEAHLATFRTVA